MRFAKPAIRAGLDSARARSDALAVPPRVEIAVVGAGPAGATVARLLARQGRQVLLINSRQPTKDRLEILSPNAMSVVSGLQLEDILQEPAIARPCVGIRRLWGRESEELDDFIRRPGSKGFVIDRARLDARLRTLAHAAGAAAIEGRVLSVRQEHDSFELQIGYEGATTRLSASLVVDATGRAAAVACRLGAERILTERLVAECQLFDRSGLPSQEAVWLEVEGHSGSWTYMTFGPDGRREGWIVYQDHRRHFARGNLLNASAACLTHAAGQGWIAIGDAAAAFDPIASQGLVNALSSALVAAGVIATEGDITLKVAADYSAAMIATFMHSERGRAEVYRAIQPD
jgi:flavin-dependent dehydrogenase